MLKLLAEYSLARAGDDGRRKITSRSYLHVMPTETELREEYHNRRSLALHLLFWHERFDIFRQALFGRLIPHPPLDHLQYFSTVYSDQTRLHLARKTQNDYSGS